MQNLRRRINASIIKCYNWLMKTRFINLNNKICRRIKEMLFHNVCYECEANFGEKNPTRKIYVIRSPQSTMGFFGLYNFVVSQIKRAEELGYEPIVDWKYYPNSSVTTPEVFAKKNAWDLYFEPISDLTLEEVYESKHVLMSSGEPSASLGEVRDSEKLLKSKEIIEKYMRPCKAVKDRFSERYFEFGMDKERILGILCRGTDFAASKPKYHTICPTAEQMIDIIEKKMNEWGYYEHIFVATEDKAILSVLKQRYGDRLLVNQQTMLEYTGSKWLNEWYTHTDSEKCSSITMEYFVSILLLSECDALIAPVVGGTLGAMRMKGSYEKVYFTQLGSYK